MVWAIFIAGYLSLRSRFPVRMSKVIAAVGATSFSIYLLHPTIFEFLAPLVPIDGGQPFWMDILATTLVSLPVVISISTATFFLIEKPFLRLRVRYLSPPALASHVELNQSSRTALT